MAIQDQSDGTGAVSSVRDAASFSRSSARCDLVLGSIATNSSVDEQIPKVRKPYTITKKRERWTDEEHEKFLEALKLYGRSWRQIEEYVGTKTAVQIRSHAQKFFSKVGRGSSNGGTESSIKPIEIPPPRPKRKPSHPYPRKFTGTLEGTSAERGRQSPTSVLSAGSSGSALTEQLGGCHSPLSCTTDMHSNSSVPAEKENECMTSDLYHKGKEPFPFLQLNTTSGQDNMSLKKFKESEDTDGKVTKNASSGNIRLFGTIFTAPNSEEHSGTEKSVSLSLKLGQEGLQTVQSVDSELALARANSNLKPVPCVAPPVHPMEVDGNSNQPGANYISPFQKWPLYQGLGNIHHSIFTGTAETPFCSPAEQNLKESDIAKEVSSTGSNSGSVDEAENEKNVDAADSNSQLGCGQEKFSTFKSTKGFVPYKRSLSERDMDSSKIDSDKTKGQRPRVCL